MKNNETNEFWRSLEEIGEDEVRLRLAKKIYGDKNRRLVEEWLRKKKTEKDLEINEREQSTHDDEFQISRSSLNINRIVAVAALFSIIISIGALAISWLAYRAAHTEKIVLTVQRYMGDYASKIDPQPGILGPAIFDTYWECLLSNTGDMTISIVEGNVWRVDNGGLSQYSSMRGGVLDESGKAITFPIIIESGHSKKLLFLLRPQIVNEAYEILQGKYSNHSIPSLRIAQNFLAGNKIDFFGNPIMPFYDGDNVIGFRVENSDKQPEFAFKFVTSRGKTVVGVTGWYPSPPL